MKRNPKKDGTMLLTHEAPIAYDQRDEDGADDVHVRRPAQRDDHLLYGGDGMRSILGTPPAAGQ